MDDFAKIIKVDGYQVLFYLEPDNEEGSREKLHQIVRKGGLCVDATVYSLTHKEADKLFEGIDESSAKMLLMFVDNL